MIQLIVSGINGDDDVAKLTEELSNIGSTNQIMVTLGTDSRATVIVTGKASDDELTEAVKQAGAYSIVDIKREGLEPYHVDK